MTGFALHNHLMRLGRATLPVLMTAFPNDGGQTRAQLADVACYLKWPFGGDNVLAGTRLERQYSKGGGRKS